MNTTEDTPAHITHIAAGNIDPVYKGGVLDIKKLVIQIKYMLDIQCLIKHLWQLNK